MQYNILRPVEDADGVFVENEFVEIFTEAPAPARTLNSRIQELEAVTGFEHIFEPVVKLAGDSGVARKQLAKSDGAEGRLLVDP